MRYKKFIKHYPALYLWAKDNPEKIKSIQNKTPQEYVNEISRISDIELNVDKDVLIPRHETLELIDFCQNIIKEKNIKVVADIGSGSGLIGISLLDKIKSKDFQVYFVDKSKKALTKIKQNLGKNKISKNFKVFHSDLMNNLTEEVTTIEFVIANLPYIPSYKIKNLPKSVVKYEPLIALDGGKDGAVYVKRLISQIYENKIPYAFFEIYEDHELPLRKYLKRYPFKEYRFIKDSYGNMRFLYLSEPL